MTPEAVVAIVAVIVSLTAVAASSTLSSRQLRSLRNANHLPVAIELITRDMGLDEFWAKERVLARRLVDLAPDVPISQLPEPLRGTAYSVASFYDSMGILVAFGFIEERLVVATTNYRIRRMWQFLEPHIRAERIVRGSLFMDFFEDLACRAHANDPQELHDELGLRSMPDLVARRRAGPDRASPKHEIPRRREARPI